VAESGTARNLRLEYQFDRLLEEKLAQVFEVLAPEKFGSIGAIAETKEAMNDQAGSHLRAGVFGSTEGRSHDREPDGGVDPVCGDGGIRRTQRVDLSRRRL
jgi:hypothetical protein